MNGLDPDFFPPEPGPKTARACIGILIALILCLVTVTAELVVMAAQQAAGLGA